MALFTVRSERQFCERLDYDLLFRFFLGMNLANAVVVLSATSGARDFVDGVPVFYSVAGDFVLPVPHEDRAVTNQDGNALVFNAPIDGGDVYLQVWGFPDAAAVAQGEAGLVLVAEHTVARRAGVRTWVNLWANID